MAAEARTHDAQGVCLTCRVRYIDGSCRCGSAARSIAARASVVPTVATGPITEAEALRQLLDHCKVQTLEALRAGRWSDVRTWCLLVLKLPPL